MTRKNKDFTKLTRRTFAAGTAVQTALQQRRGVVRSFGLSALLMGSVSVATLTLALSVQAQEASPTPIPDISVTAPPAAEASTAIGAAQPGEGGLAAEGSEAAGYKADDSFRCWAAWQNADHRRAIFSQCYVLCADRKSIGPNGNRSPKNQSICAG